ncbi:MAG: AAA family ATPase [Planctomycetes bacterium]|nr:AAA family ATPase [Planctomycetota bacterium]
MGKTTTAVNLAACVAVANMPTLLVDLDPQSNATSAYGISAEDSALYRSLVLGDALTAEHMHTTEIKRLMIVPSTVDLVGAELELADVPNRTDRLMAALAPHKKNFRFIFVDCPPSLSLLTINALRAAGLDDAVPRICAMLPSATDAFAPPVVSRKVVSRASCSFRGELANCVSLLELSANRGKSCGSKLPPRNWD